MQLYSTNNPNYKVDLKTAVLKSLAPDKGLYMPSKIDRLSDEFFKNLKNYSLSEIGFHVCANLFQDSIGAYDLWKIVNNALTFPAPVVKINDKISTLELFHGPSLAFKDFGARFMAQLMSHYNKDENKKLTILVATSGDTGGAVASGFYKTEGVEVIILYPKGKVSDIQEKQLTTLGENIYACEIEGTFDDCQALVKTAFLDDDLNDKYRLSSANSINIARLIPQSFYYFEAIKQVDNTKENIIAIPSGNFGNLTAGLLAKEMGLSIEKFIAATNENHIVPDYLSTGEYNPKPSIATISNAMDVGNPSNFVRMMELYNKDHKAVTKDISGYWTTDKHVLETIKRVYENNDYVLDPHGAIGFLACEEYIQNISKDKNYIFLETAHPCKFLDTVESVIDHKIDLPQRVKELLNKKKEATQLNKAFPSFKEYMLSR